MCDSSQVTSTPSITVRLPPSSGNSSATQGGKQLPVESSSMSNNLSSDGQQFIPGMSMLQQQVQQQNHNNSLAQIHGHNLGIEPQHAHNQQQHSNHNMHHSMHSMQGNGCSSTMQHQFMDNHHHHVQQMNLPHQLQHGSHQMSHAPPSYAASHPHHIHPHHSPQQYVPFGMHMNTNNNMGNGSTYSNHQINPFVHHPQIPNQQPAHAMNMGLTPLQQSCFLQHQTCMHFQHNSPPIAQRSPAGGDATGWMNGPPGPMTLPNQPISSTNHNSNAGTGTFVQAQNISARTISASAPKVQAVVSSDSILLPGGLEVLWRELPSQCQTYLQPQDIPDTAKFRGYFTVCELLVLKRALESRHQLSIGKGGSTRESSSAAVSQQCSLKKITGGGLSKVEKHGKGKGPKRGGNSNRNNKISSTANTKGNRNRPSHRGKNNGVIVNERNHKNSNDNVVSRDVEMMQEDNDENSLSGELMISLDNIKHEIHTAIPPAVTGVGVGGAVKEAVDAISSSTSTTSVQNATDNEGNLSPTDAAGETSTANTNIQQSPSHHVDNTSSSIVSGDGCYDKDNDRNADKISSTADSKEDESNEGENQGNSRNVSGNMENGDTAMMQGEDDDSSIYGELMKSLGNSKHEIPAATISPTTTGIGLAVNELMAALSSNAPTTSSDTNTGENQSSIGISETAGISNTPSNNVDISHSVASAGGGGGGYFAQAQLESRYIGPAPPCRTATLVFKLLQIGGYHIRSFSNVNPNRLRVLFNTQRMMYECQLPVSEVPNLTNPGSPPHLVRKVLTVDIGFEQISQMKFGSNSLWMRVEGPPLLTITTNTAQDEGANEALSPHDQFVLDQIDKGQLKLSPIHQLYFLNERLVHLLESQFRIHPRFGHLLMAGDQHVHQIQQ